MDKMEVIVICPVKDCNLAVAKGPELSSHLAEMHPQHVHFCDWEDCVAVYTRASGLKNHKNSAHLQIKPYECPDCNKKFGQRSDLKRHVNAEHDDDEGDQTFVCGGDMDTQQDVCQCGKRYGRRYTLNRHKDAVREALNAVPSANEDSPYAGGWSSESCYGGSAAPEANMEVDEPAPTSANQKLRGSLALNAGSFLKGTDLSKELQHANAVKEAREAMAGLEQFLGPHVHGNLAVPSDRNEISLFEKLYCKAVLGLDPADVQGQQALGFSTAEANGDSDTLSVVGSFPLVERIMATLATSGVSIEQSIIPGGRAELSRRLANKIRRRRPVEKICEDVVAIVKESLSDGAGQRTQSPERLADLERLQHPELAQGPPVQEVLTAGWLRDKLNEILIHHQFCKSIVSGHTDSSCESVCSYVRSKCGEGGAWISSLGSRIRNKGNRGSLPESPEEAFAWYGYHDDIANTRCAGSGMKQ